MDKQATLQRWLEEAAAAEARLAPAGVTPPDVRAGMSGLELLQGIASGTLPRNAMAATLNVIPITMEAGLLVYQATATPAHYNLSGTAHGGWVATVLDTCVSSVVLSLLPAGKAYTTIELKVNYMRAITEDTGPVRAEGQAIHVGGRIGTAEGRLLDAAGKLYAHAITTCLIFDAASS